LPSANNKRSYNGHYMAVGRNAEAIILEWLNNHPGIIGVEDLRQLRQMREADVDVSITLFDGRVALAEIKSDWHLGISGNVLFEVLRINHTCETSRSCTLGWSARSPAKWVLFYAPQIDSIYRISFHDYRKGMQVYSTDNEPKTHVVRTDNIKTTLNLLIPERYINKIGKYKIGKEAIYDHARPSIS